MTPTFLWGTGFEGGQTPSYFSFSAGGHTGQGEGVGAGGIGGSYLFNSGNNMSFQITSILNVSDPDIGLGITLPSEFYFSMWLKWNNIGTVDTITFYLDDNSYFKFYINSDKRLVFDLNGVVVATGNEYIDEDIWFHHQFHFKIAHVDGLFEHKTNGRLDISYSGDVQPDTSTTLRQINWYRAGWYATGEETTFAFDDISFCTGDWPGDIRFSAMEPIADVSNTGWYKNGISDTTPPSACSAAIGAATGITGTYRYKVTLVDANGETLASSVSSPDVSPANQKVNLSNIPIGAVGTTARKIYRNKNGGTTYYLLTTIANNTDTTYVDSTADASLPATTEPSNADLYATMADNLDTTYIYTNTDHAKIELSMDTWGDSTKQPVMFMQQVRAYKVGISSQRIIMAEIDDGSTSSSSEIELNTVTKSFWKCSNVLPGDVAIDLSTLQGIHITEEAHTS